MSKIGSSTNSRKHYYAKKDFDGTAETIEALNRIGNTSSKTLPLMSNEDFQAFCEVRRIFLEQPYLTEGSYAKIMRSLMDGWLERELK